MDDPYDHKKMLRVVKQRQLDSFYRLLESEGLPPGDYGPLVEEVEAGAAHQRLKAINDTLAQHIIDEMKRVGAWDV